MEDREGRQRRETDERRAPTPLLYVNVGGYSLTTCRVVYSVRHGSHLTHLLPSSCTGRERRRHFLPMRISRNAAGEDGSPQRQRARNRGRGGGDGGGGRRAHMNPNTIDRGYQSNVLLVWIYNDNTQRPKTLKEQREGRCEWNLPLPHWRN